MSGINSIEGLTFRDHNELSRKHETNSNEISLKENFEKKLNDLNNLQIEADKGTQQLITGEAENIHEVLLKTEEAILSLELAVKVRNKMVEAYQEIMKVQI